MYVDTGNALTSTYRTYVLTVQKMTCLLDEILEMGTPKERSEHAL
jgi:hypothetical protein